MIDHCELFSERSAMATCIRVKTIRLYSINSTPDNETAVAYNGQLLAVIDFHWDTSTIQGYSSCHSKHPAEQAKHLTSSLKKIFDVAQTCWGADVFEVWWQLHEILTAKAQAWHIAPLTCQIALSLFETALIDAFCKLRQTPFHTLLLENSFGIDFAQLRPELAGKQPGDFLATPSSTISPRIPIRLAQNELASLSDGNANHFTIILSGQPDEDYENLCHVALAIQSTCKNYRFSIDGACQFKTAEAFKKFWDLSLEDTLLRGFFAHLLHVQDPFIEAITFDQQVIALFSEWPKRPPIMLNITDATLDSLPKAIAHGYAGTTHSKFKGIFKGIANRCLLLAYKQREPVGKYAMSGEDLAIDDPLNWGQDLVVQASLGFSDVSIQAPPTPLNSVQTFWPTSAMKAIFTDPAHSTLQDLNLEQGKFCIAQLLEQPFGHTIEALPNEGATVLYG